MDFSGQNAWTYLKQLKHHRIKVYIKPYIETNQIKTIMNHSSEMRDNTNGNDIDSTRVYSTSALIKRVGGLGGAIAASSEDATLPGRIIK